jgi:bifunctional DNase/RNase
MEMMEVQILGLYLDPNSGAATVLLGEAEHVERVLPITIGPAEAQAIAIGVEQLRLPRPGTHDLLLAALAASGSRLLGVEIIDLAEGTFLAELRVETGHGIERVDARPSDGMALAVRAEVPVAVDRAIFEEAGVAVVHEAGEPFAEEEVERIMTEFHEFLETAEPSDFEAGAPTDDSAPGDAEGEPPDEEGEGGPT